MKRIETEEAGERAGERAWGGRRDWNACGVFSPLNEKQVTVHCVSGLICKRPPETPEKTEKEGGFNKNLLPSLFLTSAIVPTLCLFPPFFAQS